MKKTCLQILIFGDVPSRKINKQEEGVQMSSRRLEKIEKLAGGGTFMWHRRVNTE